MTPMWFHTSPFLCLPDGPKLAQSDPLPEHPLVHDPPTPETETPVVSVLARTGIVMAGGWRTDAHRML